MLEHKKAIHPTWSLPIHNLAPQLDSSNSENIFSFSFFFSLYSAAACEMTGKEKKKKVDIKTQQAEQWGEGRQKAGKRKTMWK